MDIERTVVLEGADAIGWGGTVRVNGLESFAGGLVAFLSPPSLFLAIRLLVLFLRGRL